MRKTQRRASRLILLLVLSLLLALTCSCGSEIASPSDGSLTKADSGDYSPVPEWVGVYENKDGYVAVLEYEEDMCRFIVDISSSGGDGYLAGYAQVDGSEALFSKDDFIFTMKLVNDTMTISQEGENPYANGDAAFFGKFSRSDADPDSIVPREADGVTVLPEGVSRIKVQGTDAYMFIDPQGRFSVTLPDVGSVMPEDKQPDGGVYFENGDGTVSVSALFDEKSGEMTQDKIENYLAGEYGNGTSAAREDGFVLYSYNFTDEDGTVKTDEVYAKSTGGGLLTVHIIYDAVMKNTCGGYGGFVSAGEG